MSNASRPQSGRAASASQQAATASAGSNNAKRASVNRWASGSGPIINAEQPNGSSSRESASSGSARPQSQIPDEVSVNAMHDQNLFYLMSMVGSKIVATARDGTRWEGILSAASSDGGLSIAVKHAYNLDDTKSPPKRQLLLPSKDLVDIHVVDIDLERRVAAASTSQSTSDSFRTDSDISGANAVADGRTLQRWDASAAGEADLGLDGSSSKRGTAWDQFAVNERMFGTKTDYNEELYTTKLDRSSANYKERERKADRIAAEILTGTSSNPHVLEERNAASAGQDVNEEDRYGAVIRGPNAYLPPAARAAAKLNTENVASVASTSSGAPTPIRQPSQILATSGSAQSGGTTDSSNTLQNFVPDIQQFVHSEKERVAAKRQAQAKKEKDSKLADLLTFSQNFKYNAPIPKDLVPILAKSADKQKEIQEKAEQTVVTGQLSARAGATALSSRQAISPELAKLSAAHITSTSTASKSLEPALPGAAMKPPRFAGDRPAAITRESIAQIPPYSALKQRASPAPRIAQTASSSGTASSPAATPPVTSALTPANSAVKLNPNVTAFVPGGAGGLAAAPAARRTSVEPQRTSSAVGPVNPFFGNKVIRKGSASMHVKEDFTPFKLNATVPAPYSVPDSWGFQGKATRDLANAMMTALPLVQRDDETVSMVAHSPGTAQPLTTIGGQGMPSQFPMFRGYNPAQYMFQGQQTFPITTGAQQAGPYFVGPNVLSQAAMSPQGFAPQGFPQMPPIYRGPYGQPIIFAPGNPQMAGQSPQAGFRRLSSASSGGQGPPSPYPPPMHAPPTHSVPQPQPQTPSSQV